MINNFFFFNDTATTEIYPLSLHDALPIFRSAIAWQILARSQAESAAHFGWAARAAATARSTSSVLAFGARSEEHTSELQSRLHLVCRLLLEKKNIYRP